VTLRIKALIINVGVRPDLHIRKIYGNNVDMDFRTRLDKVIRGIARLKDFEVVTSDDHSCAASLSELPYEVDKECHGIVEAILEFIKLVSSNEVPARYSLLALNSRMLKSWVAKYSHS